jgi:DNA-binding response OmpR family regulator
MSKVLIIDDEQSPRDELRDRIESMGHEVDEATSVEQAWKLIEDAVYDCVLLDLGIPLKFEGVPRVANGRTLLQRIVAQKDAPPVLVVTANGLDDWQLSTEVFELGGKGFIGKPFERAPIEEKLTKLIKEGRRDRTADSPTESFSGGAIVMYEDRIELCEMIVGGRKGNALIRQILPNLARKNERGSYIRSSRKELATAANSATSEGSIGAAIQEFRRTCKEVLGCSDHDVIQTHTGGGYQLREWITFKLGAEENVLSQADADIRMILGEFKKHKERNQRRLAENLGLTSARVRSALSTLRDKGLIQSRGAGANTTYFASK